MLRICKGSKTITGCGEAKMEEEFSKCYKNMCRECENKLRRNRYNEHHKEPGSEFNVWLSRPFR